VLFQGYNYGFSAAVVSYSKAQREAQGHSLVECCNADARHYSRALRVSLSSLAGCVAPLDKGAAIACEMRLAANDDKLTEFAIVTLKEHKMDIELAE